MTVIFEPAECSATYCHDETCHLAHQECWYVEEEDTGHKEGPFWTRQEAVEHNKKHLLPDEP